MAKRLTERQARFAKLYATYADGARAAREAGYSEKGAKRQAWELLHLPQYAHVQEAVKEEQERIRRRLEVTAERIQNEQARIAFANLEDFIEWDGKTLRIKPLSEIDPLELAAVKSIRETKHGVEIELHSKQAALDALARMAGLYKDALTLKSDGLLLRVAGVNETELVELDDDHEEDAD